MGQVAKLKRTWNLVLVLQTVQKITENYCFSLYLLTDQVWWLMSCGSKDNSKMHLDVKDLADHGMIKNTKTWISWERNIIFLRYKKLLNLRVRWHILRSYRFVAEVTFRDFVKAFLKDFADFPLSGIVKNLIIYFAGAFWCFSHYQSFTLLPFLSKFLSRNTFLWLFQLTHVWKLPLKILNNFLK